MRTRADVERREKRAAQRAAIEGFKLLLEEAAKVVYLFPSSSLIFRQLK